MGYNTIAFLLNDMFHVAEKSPKTLLFALLHPPMSRGSEKDVYHDSDWRKSIDHYADSVGERRLHSQILEAYTFHADSTQYVRAGQNGLDYMKVLKYGKDRKTGKHTVTLEMPEWYQREPRFG